MKIMQLLIVLTLIAGTAHAMNRTSSTQRFEDAIAHDPLLNNVPELKDSYLWQGSSSVARGDLYMLTSEQKKALLYHSITCCFFAGVKVALLLDALKECVHYENDQYNTPVHLAAQAGDSRILILLLENSSSQLSAWNIHDQTPYMIAANDEIRSLLRSYGSAVPQTFDHDTAAFLFGE